MPRKAYMKIEKAGTEAKIFTNGNHTHINVFRKDQDAIYQKQAEKDLEQNFSKIQIGWADIPSNAITIHTFDDGTAIIDLPRNAPVQKIMLVLPAR